MKKNKKVKLEKLNVISTHVSTNPEADKKKKKGKMSDGGYTWVG